MSLLVTVSDLQERVRTDCGLPTYTTETNVSTADILDFVRRGAQKLAGLIQQYRADEQYLTLSTTLSTVAGVPVISLPANCQDVVRLGMVLDNGDREIPLEVAPLDEWQAESYFWDSNTIPKYRVIGNTITLFPTPQSVRTINAYYTVGFTVATSADVLALRPNWDEYIVNFCNILVRRRQEKDASDFRADLAQTTQELVSQLKRDRAGIRQVRDVRTPLFDLPRNRRWPW